MSLSKRQHKNEAGRDGESTKTASFGSVNQNRHAALCSICKHPELVNIEADYVHWYSARDIMVRYFPDKTEGDFDGFRHSLARHGQVTGLDAKKSRNVLSALNKIAERGLDSLNNQKIAAHTTIEALKEISKMSEPAGSSASRSLGIITSQIPDNREDVMAEVVEMLGVKKEEDPQDGGSSSV